MFFPPPPHAEMGPVATAEDLLRKFYDIQGVFPEDGLEGLASFLRDEKDRLKLKELLEQRRREQQQSGRCGIRPGLAPADVFEMFPSLKVDFASFASLLAPLATRM